MTGEFLDLEREIDNFALQYEYYPSKTMGMLIRLGKHAGLSEQLAQTQSLQQSCERPAGGLGGPGPAQRPAWRTLCAGASNVSLCAVTPKVF